MSCIRCFWHDRAKISLRWVNRRIGTICPTLAGGQAPKRLAPTSHCCTLQVRKARDFRARRPRRHRNRVPDATVRRVLREQLVILHRRLLAIVRDDEVCRRLITVPGVGPVVSLTYRVTVDVPARFHRSKAVGAVFGLTCAKYQSGEIDRSGRISRCGDEMM
jgi:transposase